MAYGNVAITAGSGTNIAVDQISSKEYQRVKVAWGPEGTANESDTSTPMPVALYGPSGTPILFVDDAAFTPASSRVLPIGAFADETGTDSVDEGDVGIPRMTLNRILRAIPSLFNSTEGAESARSIAGVSTTAPSTGVQAVAGNTFTLALTTAAPTPTGTDILDEGGNAIVSGDLSIRDTTARFFMIPMAGWARLRIGFYVPSAFDQNMTWYIFGDSVSTHTEGRTQLASATLTASSALSWGAGDGAVGQGGFTGGSTVSSATWYSVPAMNAGHAYVAVAMQFGTGPTSGTVELYITRSRF